MSRTDKDMPYWVTGTWVPKHSYACTGRRERCTLPARPARRRPNRKLYRSRACHWVPPFAWRPDSPPRWFVNASWTARDRMAVRLGARRVVAEHRATGEADTELPASQHRQGALWDWN
jgi:hypothetical protein